MALNTKTKWVLGGVLIAIVVVSSVIFANPKLQKGYLGVLLSRTIYSTNASIIPVPPAQVVAGTTNVVFNRTTVRAGNVDVKIKKINVRNNGSNLNGVSNIGIYDGATLINGRLLPSLAPGLMVFDYSASPITLRALSTKILTIKANTVYAATSGQTVDLRIESIEFTNPIVSPPPNIITVEPHLSYLYPTKLNFRWIVPASNRLVTGNQIEIGRFQLGATSANANNPGAYASVSSLNFTPLGNAILSNFTLHDITNNVNIASGAVSSNFSATVRGGRLGVITFQQGERRDFKILADVAPGIGQKTQFRFTAGNPLAPGSAVWSVMNNGVTNVVNWVTDITAPASTLLRTF